MSLILKFLFLTFLFRSSVSRGILENYMAGMELVKKHHEKMENITPKERCETWYWRQPDPSKYTNDPTLLKCPCNLEDAKQDSSFEADGACKNGRGCKFHPGAYHCVRQKEPSNKGAGTQCCYVEEGSLLIGAPGGGTLDVVSPNKSLWGHLKSDVIPYGYCCKNSNECDKYYKKRPSIGC